MPGLLPPSLHRLEPHYNKSSQAQVIPKMGQNSFYQQPNNIAIQLTPSTNKWALVVTTTDVISLVKRVGCSLQRQTHRPGLAPWPYLQNTNDWAFTSTDTCVEYRIGS